MGTSLVCLQVYVGVKQKTEIRNVVIDAVRNKILNQGYVEASAQRNDPSPDRELFVGPLDDSPWLTIFVTSSHLREIAKDLSTVIEGTVIYVSLLDSNVVHLRRYSNGQMVDEYCNAPHLYDLYGTDPDSLSDWSETAENRLKAMTRGDLANWRDLFVAGVNSKQIRDLWDSDPILADDILWGTVAALGMNDEEIMSDFWAGQGRESFTRFAFQLKEKPLYETKAEGPPILSLAGRSVPGEAYVGQQLSLQISIQNGGSAFVGLDISAWGSSFDMGIVHLSKAEALRAEKREEIIFTQIMGKIETQDVPLLISSNKEFLFPQGIPSDVHIGSSGNWQKAFQAMLQAQVQFNFTVSIEKAGVGELFIAFIPHDNREDGRTVYEARLNALPMPRLPLPSKDAILPVHPLPMQLLETQSSLFGLVALGTEQKQSAEVVARIIETWVQMVARSKKDKFDTYLQITDKHNPKKKRLSASDIPESSYWQELRKGINDCVRFFIHHKAASVVYDLSTLFFKSSTEQPAPQLMFYYVLAEHSEKELDDVNGWLFETVNQLMLETSGLQAIVGKWGWRAVPTSLDATIYEAACNIHGQCTTARFWCQRFLRGVTPHLWLGSDLLGHLRERDKLDSVATVVSHGEGIRITLKDDATIDELERALDPLLPREQDWRDGNRRLFPRESK